MEHAVIEERTKILLSSFLFKTIGIIILISMVVNMIKSFVVQPSVGAIIGSIDIFGLLIAIFILITTKDSAFKQLNRIRVTLKVRFILEIIGLIFLILGVFMLVILSHVSVSNADWQSFIDMLKDQGVQQQIIDLINKVWDLLHEVNTLITLLAFGLVVLFVEIIIYHSALFRLLANVRDGLNPVVKDTLKKELAMSAAVNTFIYVVIQLVLLILSTVLLSKFGLIESVQNGSFVVLVAYVLSAVLMILYFNEFAKIPQTVKVAEEQNTEVEVLDEITEEQLVEEEKIEEPKEE